MKFELMHGNHYEREGGRGLIKFHKGAIIESPRHLHKIFKNKFRLVGPEDDIFLPKTGLVAVQKGKKEWDVINKETGKVVNENSLTEEEAKEMAYEVQEEDKLNTEKVDLTLGAEEKEKEDVDVPDADDLPNAHAHEEKQPKSRRTKSRRTK